MGQRAIRTAAVDPLQMGFPCIRRIIEVARESLLSPGTFDFLGFTLYWGRARSGTHIPKTKTAINRYSRALKTLTHIP